MRSPYVVAVAALLTLGLAAPAHALPPTSRTVHDRPDPGAAYDVTQVRLRSAPTTKKPAVVVVKHARKVAVGDQVDVWFDLDGDATPDLHVSGAAYSEFTVHRTHSFTQDGRDISTKDCARLAMAGTTSKVRLFPACLGAPLSFAVAVKSSTDGASASEVDWAPGPRRFSKPVLAAPLT